MKKLVLLISLIFSVSILNSQVLEEEKKLEPGFKYSAISKMSIVGTATICIESTCTENKGENCDTPGSSHRFCY